MSLTYNDLDAVVKSQYLPHLIDQIFVSNPLLARLMSKSKVEVKGGRDIRQPVLYGKHASGSYAGMDTFDITFRPKKTLAVWSWKYLYTNVTLSGTQMAETDSDQQILDDLDSEMQGASMTMNDTLSEMIFGDGTGNDSKDFDGLLNAVDDSTSYVTYGGLSRTSDATWWKATLDSTGGPLTLDAIQSNIGTVSLNEKSVDLLVTTQTLYDKIWARVQPSQRSQMGPHADLVNIGFTGFSFNNHAMVVVDRHCPSGYIFGLNTEYWKLVINKNKNFQWTEPKHPVDADAYIRQLLLGGNLVCISPRYQFVMTGLT